MLHEDVKALRRRIIDDIRSTFPPGTYNLSIEQVALFLGLSAGHVRNQLAEGTFPIETVPEGRRRFVPLTALADHQVEKILTHKRPKIGRPSKASRRVKSMLSSAECNHG